MWQTREALEAGTNYTRLKDNRWRAEYRGFVSIEAVGDSPHDCQSELVKAFDSAVSSLIARTRRTGTAPVGTIAGTEPVRRAAPSRVARRVPAKPAVTRRKPGNNR